MRGFDTIASALPARRRQASIDLPEKARAKFAKLAGKVFSIVGPSKAQEIVGEMGTALLINLMGFKQSPSRWKWSKTQGPDQIAKHEAANVWGIFEAKGGGSPLGSSQWGPQMREGWLEHWIREIIRQNGGEQRDDLRRAFQRSPMLAAVVRVNILDRSSQLKITLQNFERGERMRSWGDA